MLGLCLLFWSVASKSPSVFSKYSFILSHITEAEPLRGAVYVDRLLDPPKALSVNFLPPYHLNYFHLTNQTYLVFTRPDFPKQPCLSCRRSEAKLDDIDFLMAVREKIVNYLGTKPCYTNGNLTCDVWSMGSLSFSPDIQSRSRPEKNDDSFSFYALQSNGYPDAAVGPTISQDKYVFSEFKEGVGAFDEKTIFHFPCNMSECGI